MFDQTFVNGRQDSKRPATILASLLLQIAVMCIIIVIPLIYSEALPSIQLRSFLIAPPAPPTEPPHQAPARVQRKMTRPFKARELVAPRVIPNQVLKTEDLSPAPEIGFPPSAGEQNSAPTGMDQSILGFKSELPAMPQPPAKRRNSSGPVRIGGRIAQANLIQQVQPVYPALAKSARVQGRVEFTAIISKNGRIENLQLVTGHPLLVNAAREAVLQWRYRPTLLNGEPVEVVTDIVVDFALNP